jgi:hypothetical protein
MTPSGQTEIRERNFSILQNVQGGSGVHHSSYSVDTGFVPGMKWPGPELNHLHPYSAEDKNDCCYTSISPFQYAFIARTGTYSRFTTYHKVCGIDNNSQLLDEVRRQQYLCALTFIIIVL